MKTITLDDEEQKQLILALSLACDVMKLELETLPTREERKGIVNNRKNFCKLMDKINETKTNN